MHLGMTEFEYHFGVTVTLNSDLVSMMIVSEAYLLYYLRYWNHIFGVLMHLGMTKGCILFSGFCD